VRGSRPATTEQHAVRNRRRSGGYLSHWIDTTRFFIAEYQILAIFISKRSTLLCMPNPHIAPPTTTVYVPFGKNRWSATMQTPGGPVTATGSTISEAQDALDELLDLLVLKQALTPTREKQR